MILLLRTAILYGTLVFAVGFILGTIRVLFVSAGSPTAIYLWVEIPVMLAASYAIAGIVVRRFGVSRRLALKLGIIGWLWLMLLEWGVLPAMIGQSLGSALDELRHFPRMAGSVAQLAVAWFPWWQLRS